MKGFWSLCHWMLKGFSCLDAIAPPAMLLCIGTHIFETLSTSILLAEYTSCVCHAMASQDESDEAADDLEDGAALYRVLYQQIIMLAQATAVAVTSSMRAWLLQAAATVSMNDQICSS